MTFRFRRYPVEPTPSNPSGVIYRPRIPIWIGVGGGPRIPFVALLDTGADDTALPISAAFRLGVELDRGRAVPFRGVGGLTFGYFAEVTMELRQSPKSYRWSAQVAFLPDPVEPDPEEPPGVSLGHTGFFRYFHANFDFQRGRVRVRPNGLFVGQRG